MPSIGNLLCNFLTISIQIPASLGVQGPGDRTIALGFNSVISLMFILSFL